MDSFETVQAAYDAHLARDPWLSLRWLVPCLDCGAFIGYRYAVTDEVWGQATDTGERDAHLCLPCLDSRMRERQERELELADFPRELPVNLLLYLGYHLAAEARSPCRRAMTPSDIEVLIHCHVTMVPHPRQSAPAVQSALDRFERDGLIQRLTPDGLEGYSTTQRGVVLMKMLCETPYPQQQWVDPRLPSLDR